MTDIKSLELLYSENGQPLSADQSLLLGDYDIRFGMELKFYMHNPNESIVANISKIKAANDMYTFTGPDFINPGETVQVSIRIQAEDNLENIAMGEYKERKFPKDSDQLVGSVRWENVSR